MDDKNYILKKGLNEVKQTKTMATLKTEHCKSRIKYSVSQKL